ncbi:MAG: GNAT family N-acetyltransferase [Clostridiales bacterium]|nr:GNAT family N-acetyltransferase [Clostridiales bacterium]
MSIIQSHDITLYGSTSEHNIVLEPLRDVHLKYLYKWGADPDVVSWTQSGDSTEIAYEEEEVLSIYSNVSVDALCFIVKANDVPIGECWIQKMNRPEVLETYPDGLDIRRIDMAIGEKAYWNKGIGSAFIKMLIDYAFYGEGVDVLHCICEDYNHRSIRMWEKNHFTRVGSIARAQPSKGNFQYHFSLTQNDFVQSRNSSMSKFDIFSVLIKELQPSQPYLSKGKLLLKSKVFNTRDISAMAPIRIAKRGKKYIICDAHTSVYLAYMNGFKKVPCYIDTEHMDMSTYEMKIDWCKQEGINKVADLATRIIEHKYYEVMWLKKCMQMRRTQEI